MMPMIICFRTAGENGFPVSAFIIRIRMVPVVRCPAPLRRIWRKASNWRRLYKEQKSTYPAPLPQCLIWERAADQ